MAAFVVGAGVLAGWALDIAGLKSGFPGLTATQPLSAVCLMLCALALGAGTSTQRMGRVISGVSAALVLVIAGAILAQNALDTDWGLDRLLFHAAVVDGQTGPYLRAGRPAGAAVVGFCLLGICLLSASATHAWAQRFYVVSAMTGMVGATAVLLAYSLNLKSLYVMGLYVQVGLITAIALVLLFAGLLVRRADLVPMKHLCGESLGAVSTRRLLSWTACVLIVVGGVVQFGTHAAWYRAELEIALVTLAGIGLLFAGLVSHARRIDALEEARRGIAGRLQGSEARELRAAQSLAESFQRKHEFLDMLAHELRNPLAPLRNGVHILRYQTDGDEKLKPTVDMMDRQIRELARAIEVLIDEYGRDPPK
jgi:hypothetical protein